MRLNRTRWILRSLSALALAGLGGMVTAGACITDEEPCGKPWNLCPVVNEDGTSNGVCSGKCVMQELAFFSEPLLLWMGSEESEPSCEDLVFVNPETGDTESIAPTTSFLLQSAPAGEAVCPECACIGPDCVLPRMVAANSLSACEQTTAATSTPFNPPPDWRGACVSPGTVPSERVRSIWTGPATEAPCTATTFDLPPPETPSQIAVACRGIVAENQCPELTDLCLVHQQEANLPPGWRYCIVGSGGDQSCYPPAPPGDSPTFSDKITLISRDANGADCEPCICLPGTPSRCQARVNAYADRACSEDALIGTAETSVGQGDGCLQFDAGPALGSIRAEWEVNEPGSCIPAGGEPKPTTVCCLPEPTG
ncbi:hypothetical protein SOCE26_067630 [Sorangium cellulosum]|uniref:Secreted protein n=1 Tax=Sorangium cellulosum TaxID=56 RepID=A0A2L0F125_SORCE|nr:hypothetical protein [Sorangium cellulosum]AUX45282.1 hypothetical protein SOCE26_067630 [Sorangium cellulosum]